MATWITHLMVADRILSETKGLDRRGFCVGNIAPDCNVENEDWTAFTPSRQVTHWMNSERKVAADCEQFYTEYVAKRMEKSISPEHLSFLAGYYCHLIADAVFQKMIRDEKRVQAVWSRIHENEHLMAAAAGFPETWDTVKRIIPKRQRMGEIYAIEAEYLAKNPNSGYLTEILPLKEFPDYIDYLPHGCIVRKIGVMGYVPTVDAEQPSPVSISKEEHQTFVDDAVALTISNLKEKKLIFPEDRSGICY